MADQLAHRPRPLAWFRAWRSRYQVVTWWPPSSWAWGWAGPWPHRPGLPGHGAIYAWRLALGPLEVRRWTRKATP